MTKHTLLNCPLPLRLSAFAFMFSAVAQAGPVFSDTDSSVYPAKNPPAERKWSFSAGASVRSIGADFSLKGSRARPLLFGNLGVRQGAGNVGLFTGGSGAKDYDNGRVGPSISVFGFGEGAAYGRIDTAEQISRTGRLLRFFGPQAQIYNTEFNTYQLDLYQSTRDVSITDDEVVVGPSLQAGYSLKDTADEILNFTLGWSYFQSGHHSGSQILGEAALKTTKFSYNYDSVFGNLPTQFPANFPASPILNSPFATDADALLLPGITFGDLGIRDPRLLTEAEVETFELRGSADLDVDLNEIPLGLEYGRRFGNLEVLLTGGATINVIDYELNSQAGWYRKGSRKAIVSQRWSDEDVAVKVGIFGGLKAKYPLCASERVYLEAHGSYRWVDPVHATAGIADVEINPSSWEGGLGIGIVLP